MKAVLIGSDFILDDNGNVKLIETNTNTSIYDSMINQLDYSELIALIETNSITELIYIYSNEQYHHDNSFVIGMDFNLDKKLEEIATNLGITYDKYQVNNNSITVPYIEDTPTKLIIRQAYDGTALIDETYCANKANLQELIKNETYAIPTSVDIADINVDTLVELTSKEPNIVVKAIHPMYDGLIYPQLHTISTLTELEEIKAGLTDDFFVQEFVNSEENLLEGKYSIIRSLDLVYGSNLDTIHLGSYQQSSPIELSTWNNEYIDSSSILTNKSRTKWITKRVTEAQQIPYHIDAETVIVDASGSYIGIDDITIGTHVKSLDFSNLLAATTNEFNNVNLDVWTSSYEETENSLVVGTSDVIAFRSSSYDGVAIQITLEDANVWDDTVTSTYYVELSGSNTTKFKTTNYLQIGDKIITLDNDSNILAKTAITALDVKYVESKMIYEVDVEDSDIFLSVLDNVENTSIIQHNPCWGCYGYNCGSYACSSYCPGCQSCFRGDALIGTPTGERRIDEIEEGDEVLSYDFDNNIVIHKKVIGLWKTHYDNNLVIINGKETKATINHPFAVKDVNGNMKWACYDMDYDTEFHVGLDLENLKVGEHYVYLNDVWELVETITLEPFEGMVYNLTIEDVHNYISENLLVHNMPQQKLQPKL